MMTSSSSSKFVLLTVIAAIVVGAFVVFQSMSSSGCPTTTISTPCSSSEKKKQQNKKQKSSSSSSYTAHKIQLQQSFPRSTPTFNIPDNVSYVVIEVGTNEEGEFAHVCATRPDCFYIAVEPLTGERTIRTSCSANITKRNTNFQSEEALHSWRRSRCTVLTAAVSPKPGWATLKIAESTACSSLSANGTFCGRKAAQIKVPLITVDEIIDMIPRNLSVKLLSFDCQGNDFDAVSTLKRHRDRVANIVAEIQDLPLKDPRWFYHTAHNKNAGHLRNCMMKRWDWVETGASINHHMLREHNIHFSNPNHPLKECLDEKCQKVNWMSPWRHPKRRRAEIVNDDGTCPDENF